MNRRGGIGLAVFLLCIILVISIILVVIFIRGRPEPIREEPVVNVTKLYFNITIESNARYRINYVLSNATNILVKGFYFPDKIEHYDGGIEENTSIVLEAFSDDYYYDKVVCFVNKNNLPCRIDLVEKANDFSVILDLDNVSVDPSNKTIKAPVLLCFTEKANVANVRMNLSLGQVPADLKTSVDFCYQIPENIVNETIIPIDIRRNPFVNESGILKVLVRSWEHEGYVPIMDKESGILVSQT